MKKTLFLLLMTVMGSSFADAMFNNCELGQRCQIPVYQMYGTYFAGHANIFIPTPSINAPALGNFQCTLESSNTTAVNQVYIGVGNYSNIKNKFNVNNLAIIEPSNMLLLTNQVTNGFTINWAHPNLPHNGIGEVAITSFNTLPSELVNADTKLYLTCVKI